MVITRLLEQTRDEYNNTREQYQQLIQHQHDVQQHIIQKREALIALESRLVTLQELSEMKDNQQSMVEMCKHETPLADCNLCKVSE